MIYNKPGWRRIRSSSGTLGEETSTDEYENEISLICHSNIGESVSYNESGENRPRIANCAYVSCSQSTGEPVILSKACSEDLVDSDSHPH